MSYFNLESQSYSQNSTNNFSTNIYRGLMIDNVISIIDTFYNFQASTKLLFCLCNNYKFSQNICT